MFEGMEPHGILKGIQEKAMADCASGVMNTTGGFGLKHTIAGPAPSVAYAGNEIDILNDSTVSAGVGTDAPPSAERDKPSKFNQFLMTEDIKMIYDFILYYKNNKFKKFKHSNKTLNDDLFLNQKEFTDRNLLMDIYYKMR